jgi:hypothetical protein
MKKIFSVLMILCWLAPSAFSQGLPQQPGAGGLESMKIGFITQKLNLTPAEAEKFWPIYRLYSNEVRQTYFQHRNEQSDLVLQQALLDIRKKYSVEFLKAIPPPKINDFFRAERDFYDYVRREAKRRLEGRRYPPPPNR